MKPPKVIVNNDKIIDLINLVKIDFYFDHMVMFFSDHFRTVNFAKYLTDEKLETLKTEFNKWYNSDHDIYTYKFNINHYL